MRKKSITKNGLTLREEKFVLKASREVKQDKSTTRAMDIKQAIAYLKKL